MSTPSATLSQDLASSLGGVNLKWVLAGLATVKELSLIYFKNSSDADIVSMDIASGLVKNNLPLSNFVSGQAYSFQLQVVDVSDNMVFSNTLVLTAPWSLVPPVISTVSGGDQSLRIQLGATANVLSSVDSTVEFVLKREDNVVFWIIKPYANAGPYILSSADDPRLTNNVSYRVACMFQPSASNTRYSAPSAMSSSVTATPSNIPNAPQSVTSSTSGTGTLDVLVNWTRPSDFSEWSASGYSIMLGIQSSLGGSKLEMALSNTDVTSHLWPNLDAGASYLVSVQYANGYGIGPPVDSTSGYITPTSQPDAPVLISASDGDMQSILQWYAPSFDGQSAITGYNIYKDGALYTSVSGSTFTCTVTGLQNGFSYTFYVDAVNAVGTSVSSASLTAIPHGQMSIVSVVASGKTLTATINPNGRAVDRVVFIALDGSPNDTVDGEFVAEFTQQQITQSATQNITVVKTFSQFSSDITFYCAIAHNPVNSAFLKSP
jgi:hypothetical protein